MNFNVFRKEKKLQKFMHCVAKAAMRVCFYSVPSIKRNRNKYGSLAVSRWGASKFKAEWDESI